MFVIFFFGLFFSNMNKIFDDFFPPVTTMLISGIAGLGIYFVRSSVQILITACVFSLMVATANFVITSVAVDVFPTHVSAAAVCMMVCLGRFGAVASNLAFGMLLDLSCEIPIFLMAGVTICEYNKIFISKSFDNNFYDIISELYRSEDHLDYFIVGIYRISFLKFRFDGIKC